MDNLFTGYGVFLLQPLNRGHVSEKRDIYSSRQNGGNEQ